MLCYRFVLLVMRNDLYLYQVCVFMTDCYVKVMSWLYIKGYQLTVNSELARFRESDCLIKTKHCDGSRWMLTQCDFCPVL